ncbi:MAG: nitrilase-related carbon-nitrogen hydrolase, partial [Nitrososphaeraceae archaeon]
MVCFLSCNCSWWERGRQTIKFGVLICYDIVFSEVARSYVKKGAEVLFIPSKITNRGIK